MCNQRLICGKRHVKITGIATEEISKNQKTIDNKIIIEIINEPFKIVLPNNFDDFDPFEPF